MAAYSLDLSFISGKPRKPDGLRHHPIAQVYLKTYTSNSRGRHYLTPQCANLREIELEIDRLKNGLEQIKKKARKRFAGL